MRVNINAKRCVEYLRKQGVVVSDEMADAWEHAEKFARIYRRQHRAELKKSCGHFRVHDTLVYSAGGGRQVFLTCNDCGRVVRELKPPTPPRGGGEPIPIQGVA